MLQLCLVALADPVSEWLLLSVHEVKTEKERQRSVAQSVDLEVSEQERAGWWRLKEEVKCGQLKCNQYLKVKGHH